MIKRKSTGELLEEAYAAGRASGLREGRASGLREGREEMQQLSAELYDIRRQLNIAKQVMQEHDALDEDTRAKANRHDQLVALLLDMVD